MTQPQLTVFKHFRGIILPLVGIYILSILFFVLVGIVVGILGYIGIGWHPMFGNVVFFLFLAFVMISYHCVGVYLGDGKHTTVWKDITFSLKLIFSDFHNWGVLLLILLPGVVIDDLITTGMVERFGVETLATVIICSWYIIYNLFVVCFIECFVVITYRQSSARLFLKCKEDAEHREVFGTDLTVARGMNDWG